MVAAQHVAEVLAGSCGGYHYGMDVRISARSIGSVVHLTLTHEDGTEQGFTAHVRPLGAV